MIDDMGRCLPRSTKGHMLRRVITSVGLLVVGVPAILLGGIPYFLLISLFLGVAAWEYGMLFRAAQFHPPRPLLVIGVVATVATRAFFPNYSISVFTIFMLIAMTQHLIDYERGQDNAGIDFTISVTGLAYLGWIGAYLVDLRFVQNGAWWLMLILPTVWLVDTGAYSIGVAYGKHFMTPRLSPKKTWEGFWAGAISGMLCSTFFSYAYSVWGPLHVTLWQGALFGLAVGMLSPLGDLGESMLKRQAGIKDSGNLFPGHGGALDRIDSWLWAAVLGYYFVTWFAH